MKQIRYMKRKCKICKELARFITAQNQGFCGDPDCGIKLRDIMWEKEAKARSKKERADLKERKEALLTVSDWTKKVQKAFNAYIRERDKRMPCISCDRLASDSTPRDCGHFRSVGAAPELRFEPLNAHAQCIKCNRGGEKWRNIAHTISQKYRERLIDRIGLEKVEWLEGPHEPKRYRIEELKELERYWKLELKKIKDAIHD